MNNYATILGKKIFSIGNQPTYGNFKINITDYTNIGGIHISESPFETKFDDLARPKLGEVEIRTANKILQKNRITDSNLSLEKNAKLFQGATVYQYNKKIGLVQKGGNTVLSILPLFLSLNGCFWGSQDNSVLVPSAVSEEPSAGLSTETINKVSALPQVDDFDNELSTSDVVVEQNHQELDKIEIEDLMIGLGKEVMTDNMVSIHYSIASHDNVFYNSEKDGPFFFVVGQNQMPKGCDQGIIGMKVGGIREIKVPSYLAYGTEGTNYIGKIYIPPNCDLIIRIEVVNLYAIN